MKLQRIIRYSVIVTSLCIFCFQMKVALDQLMGNETIDSSEHIPISDLEFPPVITFCPRQGENSKVLEDWGYKSSIMDLLSGD